MITRIFIALCLWLLLPPCSQAQQRADDVLISVTVTNKRGNYLKGLKSANVVLFDEKVEHSFDQFAATDTPVSIGILLDRSASMHLPPNEASSLRQALGQFITKSNPSNEYFLVGFNKQPQLLVEWTREVDSLLSKFNALPEAAYHTALYDACYVGLEKVARGSHRRHVLILISDGLDNESRFKFAEVKAFLQESDAVLYGVIPPAAHWDGSVPGNVLMVEGGGSLDELTTLSGGMLYTPHNAKEMIEVFDRIAVELRNQYLLSFKPRIAAGKPKYRRIKLKVKQDATLPPEFKDLIIRTRQGYFAPGA
jgi:Ca-activated chloride channel family protein